MGSYGIFKTTYKLPEPEIDPVDYDLYDSDTADRLLADELGISPEEYEEIILYSLKECGPEGHCCPEALNGRRVYAA